MQRFRISLGIVLALTAFIVDAGLNHRLPAQDEADEPWELAADIAGAMRPAKYEFRITPFALHGTKGGFVEANDLGAAWCRYMVRWGDIETAPGVYKFDKMDSWVRQTQKQGQQVVTTLIADATPSVSAATRRAMRQAGVQTLSEPPSEMSAWLEFVRRIVERYDGDGKDDMSGLLAPVNHWQVENEWLWQWQGTVDEFIDLLVQSSRTIKQANGSAKVIAAASTKVTAFGVADGLVDRNYIDIGDSDATRQRVTPNQYVNTEKYRSARAKVETLLRDGRNAFDIVDIHCYSADPWDIGIDATWMKQEMQRNGYDKPIWALETAGPFFDFTDQKFSEDVVKRHLIGMTHGVGNFFWSSLMPTLGWPDNYIRLALIDTVGQRTPAYYTYQLLTSKLEGMQSVEPAKSPAGVFGASVYCKDGRTVLVGWSDVGERELTFPFAAPAAEVTHVISLPNQTVPQVERIPTVNGKLTLRISAPVFVEPAD